LAKAASEFVCEECGARSSKWSGQCPACESWNTLVESPRAAASARRPGRAVSGKVEAAQVSNLGTISAAESLRLASGSKELDRVLGGGFVPGSAVLIGGDPGIGKSTLLLQATAAVSRASPVLYVTGEESVQQVALRAQRLGLQDRPVRLAAENRLEAVLETAARERPQLLVVDSIQTMYTDLLSSAPGSVAQVRECAAGVVHYAKQSGAVVVIIGHVTKEGAIAGPRVLEHIVDAVLYFEGDTSSSFRVVRAMKNRFGAVNEIGVFAMSERGLSDVGNPSAMFIGRHAEAVPGSVVLSALEGTRPLLVEVQALVDRSHLAVPRRLCVGLDSNRLAMLLAVLHRHAGVALHDQDVFVNVVGGVRVTEPAADLAVLAAVVSSLRGRPVPAGRAVFGEVGLVGEVRPVQRGQERIREAAKLGFNKVVVPGANRPKGGSDPGIEVAAVERLDQALEQVLD